MSNAGNRILRSIRHARADAQDLGLDYQLTPTEDLSIMEEIKAVRHEGAAIDDGIESGPWHPVPGPQADFVNSTADITIMGGTAGGGKTVALLMSALNDITNDPKFRGVLVRKTAAQIISDASLWDAAKAIYEPTGGSLDKRKWTWSWPHGGSLRFDDLRNDDSHFRFSGGPLSLLLIDGLCQIGLDQFWYLEHQHHWSFSKSKSRTLATCTADPTSWVKDLIGWWIDSEGYPIPERAGRIRYLHRTNEYHWADSAEELIEQARPHLLDDRYDIRPKSVTYIPSKLADNPKVTEAHPGYEAALNSLPTPERVRLLQGCWK